MGELTAGFLDLESVDERLIFRHFGMVIKKMRGIAVKRFIPADYRNLGLNSNGNFSLTQMQACMYFALRKNTSIHRGHEKG